MEKLQSHHKNPESQLVPHIQWNMQQNRIVFDFTVKGYSETHANISNEFFAGFGKNWGLWEYDVVEVFLRFGDGPYLEMQCSPLGQLYALNIITPREDFSVLDKLSSSAISKVDNDTWTSSMSIHFEDIPGFGDKTNLNGNCFTCLGGKDAREYYALKINGEENADFHRPDLFISFEGNKNE